MRQVLTTFYEVPFSAMMQDKISLLNVFISDLQRNGISILSVGDLQRQELPNGSFVEGFVIEYRESL